MIAVVQSHAQDAWLTWVLSVMACAIGVPICGAILCSPRRIPTRSERGGTVRSARPRTHRLSSTHPSRPYDYETDTP